MTRLWAKAEITTPSEYFVVLVKVVFPINKKLLKAHSNMLIGHLKIEKNDFYVNVIGGMGIKSFLQFSLGVVGTTNKLLYHAAAYLTRVPLNSLAMRLVSLGYNSR